MMVYVVSLLGAAFALYHAMGWMNEPHPNSPTLMEQYQQLQQQKPPPSASPAQ